MKTYNNKISPIWNIIERDNVVELRKLISKGAFINIERQSGIKPIHYAAKKGALKCLQYIIEEGGISVEELDRHGHQPLHHAAYEGSLMSVNWEG